MQSIPKNKHNSHEDLTLSVKASSYKVVPQLSFPSTTIIIKSEKNTPLMLYIKSPDSSQTKQYKFSAGEVYVTNNPLLPSHIPIISTFEIYDKNSENSNFSSVKNEKFHQCRICLEHEISQVLIAPCLCKGHQKYVHENCLKIWLLKSEKEEKDLTACEVCKGKFTMSFTYSRQFECFTTKGLKFWVALIIFLFSIIFYIFFSKQEGIEERLNHGEIIGIYIGISLIGFTSLIFCICSLKTLIGNKQVTDWEILNHVGKEINI